MCESDSEAEALRDVLIQAAGYLSKLGANLRVRADRIATREMKNTHSVRKVTDKVMTICDLSMKSLVKVADVVKKAVEKDRNTKEDKPLSDRVKKHKERSRPIERARLQKIGKIMVQIPSKINLKHFMSCTVNMSRFPNSYFEQYPLLLSKKPSRGVSERSNSEFHRRRTFSSRESSKSRQDGECSDPASRKEYKSRHKTKTKQTYSRDSSGSGKSIHENEPPDSDYQKELEGVIKTKSKEILCSRDSSESRKSVHKNESSDSDLKNNIKSTPDKKSRSYSRSSSGEKDINVPSQTEKNCEILFATKIKSHQKSHHEECMDEDVTSPKRKSESESDSDDASKRKKNCYKSSLHKMSFNAKSSPSKSKKHTDKDEKTYDIERKNNNIMKNFKIPRKAMTDNNDKSKNEKTHNAMKQHGEDSSDTIENLEGESGKEEKSSDKDSFCDYNKRRPSKRLHLAISSSDDDSEGKANVANNQDKKSSSHKEKIPSKEDDEFSQEKAKTSISSKLIHSSSEKGQSESPAFGKGDASSSTEAKESADQIDREFSKNSIVIRNIIPDDKGKQKGPTFQNVEKNEKSQISEEPTKSSNQEDAIENSNGKTRSPNILEDDSRDTVLLLPSQSPVMESGNANTTVTSVDKQLREGSKSLKSTQSNKNNDSVICVDGKTNAEPEDNNSSMASNKENDDSVMIVEEDSNQIKSNKLGVDENSLLPETSESSKKPVIKCVDLCKIQEVLNQETKSTGSPEAAESENELVVDENSQLSQTSDYSKKPMIKCIDLNKLLKSPLKDKETELRTEKRNEDKPREKRERAQNIITSSKPKNNASKSKITNWPCHRDNCNDLVKKFIPKPFSISIHRLGKYTDEFLEKNHIKKITKCSSIIAQVSLIEPVNTAAKSELLNESSESSSHSSSSIKKPIDTPSKRKHVMESMKAKRMLLTYSSSSDEDTPRTPQKKPPNDDEMRKKTEINKKKILTCSSSSSSDADCLPSTHKKDKNRSSNEKDGNKSKKTKHRDRSGSKASSISQFDGNDDNVSASASEAEV